MKQSESLFIPQTCTTMPPHVARPLNLITVMPGSIGVERANWLHEKWDSIIWSDEFHITLQPGQGAVRLWREQDEPLNADCMQHQDIGAGGAVTVWGCFASDLSGVLVVSRGTIVTASYWEILEEGLIPSLDLFWFQLGDHNLSFQQDNARPHTSAASGWWFAEHNIALVPWPAKSPDLSDWAFMGSPRPSGKRTHYRECGAARGRARESMVWDSKRHP